MFLNIIMIKYLGGEKKVSLLRKEREKWRKEKKRMFLSISIFFIPTRVGNDGFLEKVSAKWDFIIEGKVRAGEDRQ